MDYPFKLKWSKPKLGANRDVVLSATLGAFNFGMTVKVGERSETYIDSGVHKGRVYKVSIMMTFTAGDTPAQDTVRVEVWIGTPHEEDPECVKVKIRNGRRIAVFTPAVLEKNDTDSETFSGWVRLHRPT